MAVELISKIKPKNNGDFKLVDVEDIEYNGKGLDEAIESGEFKGPKGDQGEKGEKGDPGAKGEKGDQGEPGPTGSAGADGADGKSAYQIWLKQEGNSGKSEEEFLASLKGAKGDKGDTGAAGADGAKGDKGEKGDKGDQGIQGEKGDKGDPFAIAKTFSSVEEMNSGFATDGVKEGQFVMIDTGNVEDEDNAKLYVKGKTAYDYVTDLSGAAGMTGPQGERGPQGVQGEKGDAGEKGDQGERGATGTRGSRWNQGTAITGTYTTATAFPSSGITDALVNDNYLNTSTGNTYRCTVAGNAATAKWVYTGNIKGLKGDKGEKGDTGASGTAGADGKTPEFEIRDGHLYAIYEDEE